MSAHTHDDVDWAARLSGMRRMDELEREALASVAARLTADLPASPTVVDVGSGSGGMSAALATMLGVGGGGTLVLMDAVDELLDAATAAARSAAGSSPVTVRPVVADAGSAELPELVPSADLIWASAVVHHLPDQQAAVNRLAAALHPGGLLAVAEGGLDYTFLPWDPGVGNPGLEGRLRAAREAWFTELRAAMPEAIRMPYGWATALTTAGLADTASFTYLVDHPAPPTPAVLSQAIDRLSWLAEIARERVDEADRAALELLLDPRAPEYLGARTDVFALFARTIHHGRRP